ncbi:MAG: Holliday junction branch migration protein RuvA [Tissierellia bacterium]|nr:Holliday junction branch migration protein RuvA [Tissierellia bacterium]
MLEYITGDIKKIGDDHIVLENGGVGYRIFTSLSSLGDFHLYDTVMVHLSFVVREDAFILYGFSEEREQAMFELLRGVSSIGPKNALSLLSTLTVTHIAQAISSGDINALCKAPGIGKKTASRIILELTDKIDSFAFPLPMEEGEKVIGQNGEMETAIEALVSLGYVRTDVQRVMVELSPDQPIEVLIKQCIMRLGS